MACSCLFGLFGVVPGGREPSPFPAQAFGSPPISAVCPLPPFRFLSAAGFISPAKALKKTEVRAAGDVFAKHFKFATYVESLGGGVDCVISGCPPRIPLSEEDLQFELDRRRPGQSLITTPRKEADICQIHSGIYDGMTTGTSICVFVPNTYQRGHDYDEMPLTDRDLWKQHPEGGGRLSAIENIGRVVGILVAGAIAKKILKMYAGTEILAYVSQVHKVVLPEGVIDKEIVTLDQIESNIVRCPDPEYAQKMISAIKVVRDRGDSVGGVVTCIARNVPWGLECPVFDKLEVDFAKALLFLPVTKEFEFGRKGTFMTDSEHNNEFYMDKNCNMQTRTNQSGGIQGGISNRETIYMRIVFKPRSTIRKEHTTVIRDQQETELIARGRHDLCVAPRAVPLVEAMVALVLVDQLMSQTV